MKAAELRKILRALYGKGKYRLTKRGEIHVYGKIPHTDRIGWYLRCFTDRSGIQTILQAAINDGII